MKRNGRSDALLTDMNEYDSKRRHGRKSCDVVVGFFLHSILSMHICDRTSSDNTIKSFPVVGNLSYSKILKYLVCSKLF